MRRPRIAVILDEDTSSGGGRYDMTKAYFSALDEAGGLPFGIPYVAGIVESAVGDFDGLLSVGGRFAFPKDWYLEGQASPSPASERLAIERAVMAGHLDRNKPILGICSGMQMLACLNGCRLTPDVLSLSPDVRPHDGRDCAHTVAIDPASTLGRIVGEATITVNSFHREAVATLSPAVRASARAPDGTIEAVELPSHRFAVGVQWHQEAFARTDHPGNRIFRAFVEACAAD